jgi:predicted nucleotidyltransferase
LDWQLIFFKCDSEGGMNQVVQEKLKELVDLCKNRGVRRLALFGSAATDSFDRSSSDLDLVVEFKPMPPIQHADNYFGLMEDLQQLFQVPVDLIELEPIRNPFFRQVVSETQEVLYEAA